VASITNHSCFTSAGLALKVFMRVFQQRATRRKARQEPMAAMEGIPDRGIACACDRSASEVAAADGKADEYIRAGGSGTFAAKQHRLHKRPQAGRMRENPRFTDK
jgi:hypothetical protein